MLAVLLQPGHGEHTIVGSEPGSVRAAAPAAVEELRVEGALPHRRRSWHDAKDSQYDLHLRQLLHVAFRVAANLGERYLRMLKGPAD
jgi:hypothetical protein